jgi:hypothetical protein
MARISPSEASHFFQPRIERRVGKIKLGAGYSFRYRDVAHRQRRRARKSGAAVESVNQCLRRAAISKASFSAESHRAPARYREATPHTGCADERFRL